MTVELRPATARDYAAFRAMSREAYVEQMVDFGGFTEGEARSKAEADLPHLLPETGPAPDHRLVVADDGGSVVGWLWIGPRGDGSGVPWVFDVRVDPLRRGEGIGRLLMEEAERVAIESGSDRVGLNVFGDNSVAIGLYESLGYRVDSQQMSKSVTG